MHICISFSLSKLIKLWSRFIHAKGRVTLYFCKHPINIVNTIIERVDNLTYDVEKVDNLTYYVDLWCISFPCITIKSWSDFYAWKGRIVFLHIEYPSICLKHPLSKWSKHKITLCMKKGRKSCIMVIQFFCLNFLA